MPDFAKTFNSMVPDWKMTKGELIRQIRLDISAEEEAIFMYTAHADAADDPLAKKVLLEIADEEKQHIGEFQRLIAILTGDEDKFLEVGAREVNEIAEEVNAKPAKR
jgi:uncharacterized protein